MYKIIVICISSLWLFLCNTNAKQSLVPADCLLTHAACKSANCTVVDPENCHQYIICKAEKRPECGHHYIGHLIGHCEDDMFYDETLGECFDTFSCPTNTTITKPCIQHEAKYEITGSCRKYRVCMNPLNTGTGEWEERKCPTRQYFDTSERKCLDGKCPGCYEPAPEYANCDESKPGQSFGHIYDCNKYFTCQLNKDDCEEGKWGRLEKQCPEGSYYDGLEKCVEEVGCPQTCWPKADGCQTEGQKIVQSDCLTGGECVYVKTCAEACYEGYWGIRGLTCSNDMFYDANTGECVDEYACPTDPNITKRTKDDGKKFPIAESCTKYKVFVDPQNNGSGKWEERKCPKGQHFDSSQRMCVDGKCPGCFEEAPKYAKCDTAELGHNFGDLQDCSKYYTCVLNQDGCEEGKWGQQNKQCPPDSYFDGKEGCVESQECPHICLPKADQNQECKTVGQNVLQDDCRSYIICKEENRSECGGPYMGYQTYNCEDEMFYDEKSGKCVNTFACPTNSTITISCSLDGATFEVAGSCTEYKVCVVPQNTDLGIWEPRKCPKSQHFDSSQRKCVNGRCPGCFEEAPSYAKCEENGAGHSFGHLTDCTKYFECKRNQNWCEEGKWGQLEKTCPSGKYFDGKESCVESQECPQICLPKADQSQECNTVGQNVLQDDCRSYIICKEELRPECVGPYMGYQTYNCEHEMFYDEQSGKCVDTFACPTNSTITISCSLDGETFEIAGSCTEYKVCVDPKKSGLGIWDNRKCPKSQLFDSSQRKCVNGRCPGCFEEAPSYAKCEDSSEGHSFGHLRDCTKYFECKRNENWCEEGKWGQFEKTCPSGKYFDGKGSCVSVGECPQTCPPRANNNVGCTFDGQRKEHSDCRSVTECVRVKTCPDTGYEEYWGNRGITCTGKYEFYSKQQNKCVEAVLCPQTKTDESGCKVRWDFRGSFGFGAFNDDKLGFCRAASGNTEWPYVYGLWRGSSKTCETKIGVFESFEVLSGYNDHLEFDGSTQNLKRWPKKRYQRNNLTFVACYHSDYGWVPGFYNWHKKTSKNKYPGFAQDIDSMCGSWWRVLLAKC